MFRAIISPIFRSTRLCVTACGIMPPRCCRPATSWVHCTTSCNTQSNDPEDGRDYRPKHVVLIGIINKPLLLHLVGCLHHGQEKCSLPVFNDTVLTNFPLTSWGAQMSERMYVLFPFVSVEWGSSDWAEKVSYVQCEY